MIVLFTDFGADDIYVAQVKAALLARHAATRIVDLLHRAPDFRVEAAAHLLAALHDRFEPRSVFLAVVDPGVGSDRDAVVVQAGERWYVGPDNGLLSVVHARASDARAWRIDWRPARLSASFHGRDLFAPIAAWIDRGDFPSDKLSPIQALRVDLGAADLAEIVYIDHYGNAMTGLRAANVERAATIGVREHRVEWARTFADAAHGAAFWCENSIGLVEIAANRDSAAQRLHLHVGDRVAIIERS
jgi:S-adenosylmethionine hydrolase